MNKTATEVVLELVASGMRKEAAIGGILNTRAAKQIIRDARRLYSNHKFLKGLPGYDSFDHKFIDSMANKGLKKLDSGAHSLDSLIYAENGDVLRRLRGRPLTGYEEGIVEQSLRYRRDAFERMMKDVDPAGFIQKYKQEVNPVTLEGFSDPTGAKRRKWLRWM